MHHWSDSDEKIDWAGIGEASHWIPYNLRRWGRISATGKEKYGRVDINSQLGWYQIHSITHPGYHHSCYPNWLWRLDCSYGSYVSAPLSRLLRWYQKMVYRAVYRRALNKWPHLRMEILTGASQHDLLHKFGVHVVRTGEMSYSIHYDYHEDNYKYSDGGGAG